jgi:hypothetical protein
VLLKGNGPFDCLGRPEGGFLAHDELVLNVIAPEHYGEVVC